MTIGGSVYLDQEDLFHVSINLKFKMYFKLISSTGNGSSIKQFEYEPLCVA